MMCSIEKSITWEATMAENGIRDLLKSNTCFELMFNLNPDASIVTRLSDGLIAYVNDGVVEMFQYSREEAVGSRTPELGLYTIPQDRKKIVALLAEHRSFDNEEILFRRKDGTKLNGVISARTLSLNDELYLFSSIRDITAQKKLRML
jgi:PAS domain S-box-containing protein